MAKPNIPDLQSIIGAGFDPKTGLPLKMGITDKCALKDGIRHQLRILDLQNQVNKYVWKGLPNGITSDLLERMLYYRGQLCFFYMDATEEFYILPYALNGEIDCYGRFTAVTPVVWGGSSSKEARPLIDGLVKKVIYDPYKEMTIDDFMDGCVLLSDYTNQMSQTNVPRQILQEPVLDAMAEAFPLARTSLIANSGIKGMRVNDEDSKSEVKLASRSITNAALTGDPWIPITAQVEFQDLTSAGSAMKSEEYLLYMQALDNYRLSLLGLKNGGLFQKKSHMLEAEQDMNDGTASLVYQDGLRLRQRFCDTVNSIWGLGMSCTPAEQVIGSDRNGNGMIGESDTSNEMNAAASDQQEVMGDE